MKFIAILTILNALISNSISSDEAFQAQSRLALSTPSLMHPPPSRHPQEVITLEGNTPPQTEYFVSPPLPLSSPDLTVHGGNAFLTMCLSTGLAARAGSDFRTLAPAALRPPKRNGYDDTPSPSVLKSRRVGSLPTLTEMCEDLRPPAGAESPEDVNSAASALELISLQVGENNPWRRELRAVGRGRGRSAQARATSEAARDVS